MPEVPFSTNNGTWRAWTIGALFIVAVGAIGALWAITSRSVGELQVIEQLRGERLARLEAEMEVVKTWLVRVEGKLDIVLAIPQRKH